MNFVKGSFEGWRRVMKKALLLVVVLIAVSSAAPAQQAAGASPYLFFAESEVQKTHIGTWTTAVATLVKAHDEHTKGITWSAYRELTGGPDVNVTFARGFSKLADLDAWTSNRRILVDVLGPVEGRAVREDLSTGVSTTDRVVALVEDLSRPAVEEAKPNFLWVATVRVADGKMTEYAALAKRVRRAFDHHGSNLQWLCYANAIGGESSELIYLYPFDAFAEVDTWPSRREVLAAALGEGEGARLASALEAITETTTSLWKLEPELSRLGWDN